MNDFTPGLEAQQRSLDAYLNTPEQLGQLVLFSLSPTLDVERAWNEVRWGLVLNEGESEVGVEC